MKTANASGWTLGLVLMSRLLLFLGFQALVALFLQSWEASQVYWLLTATLTNLVSLILLFYLFRREGLCFLRVFKFDKSRIKQDLTLFAGILILTAPVAMGPGFLLSRWLWIEPDTPTWLMFAPIQPGLLYPLLLAFPLTIAMAELATYFVYLMPRLKEKLKRPWLAILLPVLFLSLQHCTLPFIPDGTFILYRALVFLPFALMLGLALYYRPSLFPYLAILHGLADFGTGMMFVMQ